jgi:hypothetical protein
VASNKVKALGVSSLEDVQLLWSSSWIYLGSQGQLGRSKRLKMLKKDHS